MSKAIYGRKGFFGAYGFRGLGFMMVECSRSQVTVVTAEKSCLKLQTGSQENKLGILGFLLL